MCVICDELKRAFSSKDEEAITSVIKKIQAKLGEDRLILDVEKDRLICDMCRCSFGQP